MQPADFLRRLRVIAIVAGACMVGSCQATQSLVEATGEPIKEPKRLASPGWIERPWGMRYIIFVTQSWPLQVKAARIVEARKKLNALRSVELIFEPSVAIPITNPPTKNTEPLSIVVIEFDKQGNVLSNHAAGHALRGRLDQLQTFVLTSTDSASSANFRLGHFFTGLGDVSTDWAPGLCGLKDRPSPFSKTDNLYLYGPKFEIDEFSTTFGCREWAYQLYDDERPYIDVTSYVKVGTKYPGQTLINDVLGFARFGDKKPVIGQHEGHWYCLHDCPGDEQPGAIADIKSWASNNGWPTPKPPTKAPTFPDPPAKQGTYPR